MLPPGVAVRRCEEPEWAVDNFRWSPPVGGMDNVPDFLQFRRQRMEELFDERLAALRQAEEVVIQLSRRACGIWSGGVGTGGRERFHVMAI